MNTLGLGPAGSFKGLRSLDHEVLLATQYNEDMVEEAFLSRYEDIFRTSDLDPRTAPTRMKNLKRYQECEAV
jgi:DNA/RNA-binding domain of Phe-tRNA-synthetase-like protein